MWAQKLNKLDDSNFSILKKGNTDWKWKKYGKQVRGQKAWKQIREWKQVEDEAQGSLYLEL